MVTKIKIGETTHDIGLGSVGEGLVSSEGLPSIKFESFGPIGTGFEGGLSLNISTYTMGTSPIGTGLGLRFCNFNRMGTILAVNVGYGNPDYTPGNGSISGLQIGSGDGTLEVNCGSGLKLNDENKVAVNCGSGLEYASNGSITLRLSTAFYMGGGLLDIKIQGSSLRVSNYGLTIDTANICRQITQDGDGVIYTLDSGNCGLGIRLGTALTYSYDDNGIKNVSLDLYSAITNIISELRNNSDLRYKFNNALNNMN